MSSTGSTLSDEQRRRMEENRLKAIEKRNAAIARNNALLAQSQGSSSSASAQRLITPSTVKTPSVSPLSLGINPPSKTANLQQQQIRTTMAYSSSVNGNAPVNQNGVYTGSRPQATFPPVKTAVYPDKKPVAAFSSKAIVAGSCTMISRDRFLVEMGYQSEAIAIFKSIPGCAYGMFCPLTFRYGVSCSNYARYY